MYKLPDIFVEVTVTAQLSTIRPLKGNENTCDYNVTYNSQEPCQLLSCCEKPQWAHVTLICYQIVNDRLSWKLDGYRQPFDIYKRC